MSDQSLSPKHRGIGTDGCFGTALKLADKGWRVFPCAPGGKHPLTPHGFKDATTDPDQVRRWWTEHPQANLAIATGAGSGLVVLDVDVDQAKGLDGEASLRALLSGREPLPVTLEARTPRGGRHVYFRHPGGQVPCSTAKLGPGLDVRGDGGYVLVPPSHTEPGEKTVLGDYTFSRRMKPAPLPSWLHELMVQGSAAPRQAEVNGATPPGIRSIHQPEDQSEEQIRDALRSIPASLPHDDWVRVLMALHAWDESRGKELGRAWSAACAEKYRDRDFEAAWRSFQRNGGVTLGTLFELARRHGWRPVTLAQPRTPTKVSVAPDVGEVSDLVIPNWPEAPRPEAFHGPLGEFVRRLEPHTEADSMGILVQLLVGFGNLLGRTAHFEVEADRHYCNLNVVTVGNSSKARKGTAWGHVVRLLRQLDPSWHAPIAGLSTGEGLIFCVRDAVIKSDKDGGEVVVDGGVADKRLLAMESEFGRLLLCSNREGNTLSAVLRQAFDTGDLRVATKSSPQVATGAYISVIGHITGIELNLLLSKSDAANGLANRFQWVAVRRSKLLPEGGQAGELDWSDIVERLKKAAEFAKTAGCIRRSPAATVLWRQIYAELSVEQPGLLGAVTSRAEAMVMRMAMVFAVADSSRTIEVCHLEAAKAVWDYCAASARFIFGERLANPLAEKVLAMLQEAGEPGRTLAAIYEGLSGHVAKDELHAALRDLHAQGLARFEKVQTSGRPAQVWFASNKSPGKPPTGPTTAGTDAVSEVPEGLTSHNSLSSPTEPAQEWKEEL